MKQLASKTRIVATIGPASESPVMLERLLLAGMDVARLNFSHGDFEQHQRVIENLRTASRATGCPVAIMGDLPGPKMRVGELGEDFVELRVNDSFVLTTEEIIGDRERISVSFKRLPQVVKPGELLFLNDGVIELEVVHVSESDVECRVRVGGELRSRKGLNLPGIDLGMSAFTKRDHECLEFAMNNGVDAVSQSFVEDAADIEAVRTAANEMGFQPFILAKIERAGALNHIDEIMNAADGIMIARGDLGVETPISRIAVLQKKLIRRANQLGKPVITATQMLESMVDHNRPTRAEATDVANAILDGTDCVMLSGESAMGRFPVEAVKMLAQIAEEVEPARAEFDSDGALTEYNREGDDHLVDIISRNVRQTVDLISPVAVIVPTLSGRTARMVARFKLPVWITAVSSERSTCRELQFSYGVCCLSAPDHPKDWTPFVREWAASENLLAGHVLLTEGPSRINPAANPRMEIIHI